MICYCILRIFQKAFLSCFHASFRYVLNVLFVYMFIFCFCSYMGQFKNLYASTVSLIRGYRFFASPSFYNKINVAWVWLRHICSKTKGNIKKRYLRRPTVMNETVPTRGFSILPVSCYVFIDGCYVGCASGILRVGSSYGILRGILRVYFGVYFWSGVAMVTAAQKHA